MSIEQDQALVREANEQRKARLIDPAPRPWKVVPPKLTEGDPPHVYTVEDANGVPLMLLVCGASLTSADHAVNVDFLIRAINELESYS